MVVAVASEEPETVEKAALAAPAMNDRQVAASKSYGEFPLVWLKAGLSRHCAEVHFSSTCEASSFYREALGDVFVNYLAHIKRAEWDRYLMTVSEWEQRECFSLF